MKTSIKFFDKSLLSRMPHESYISKLLPRLEEEKTRIYTTLVLTLLAIGIFGFFAISPTLSTIAELNKQLDDNRFVDQKLEEKISNLALLQQKYAKMQDDLPVILSAVPTDPRMGILVGQIQAIAVTSGTTLLRIQTFPVDITTVKLGPAASTSYGLSFDIQGSAEQMGTFLDAITGFDRLITIDNIALVKSSPNDPTMKMTIKGKAFFKQQ